MTGTCIGTRMNTTDQNSARANGPLCRASRLRAKRHGARDPAHARMCGARGCGPLDAVATLAPGAPARPDSPASGARLAAMSAGSGCAHEGMGAASFMVQEGSDLGRKFLAGARRRYHGDGGV